MLRLSLAEPIHGMISDVMVLKLPFSSSFRSLQAEWLPTAAHQPDLRDCHKDKDWCERCQHPRTCQWWLLPSSQAQEAQARWGRDLWHKEGGKDILSYHPATIAGATIVVACHMVKFTFVKITYPRWSWNELHRLSAMLYFPGSISFTEQIHAGLCLISVLIQMAYENVHNFHYPRPTSTLTGIIIISCISVQQCHCWVIELLSISAGSGLICIWFFSSSVFEI